MLTNNFYLSYFYILQVRLNQKKKKKSNSWYNKDNLFMLIRHLKTLFFCFVLLWLPLSDVIMSLMIGIILTVTTQKKKRNL